MRGSFHSENSRRTLAETMASDSVHLTEDEKKLYDRSIRLWGFEAQKRIRGASILLIGMGGLNGEVAKNIVLAGVKKLSVLDDDILSECDLSAVFLANTKKVGQKRSLACEESIRDLNPYVEIVCESGSVGSKDVTFFKQFDLVCVTKQSWKEMERINTICRDNNVKFYAGDCMGYFGYFFVDLGELFKYTKTIENNSSQTSNAVDASSTSSCCSTTTTTTTTHTATRSVHTLKCNALKDAAKETVARRPPALLNVLKVLRSFELSHSRSLSIDDDLAAAIASALAGGDLAADTVVDVNFLRTIVRSQRIELAFVTAVIGGILAQELLRAIAADDVPISSWLVYDAKAATATVVQ